MLKPVTDQINVMRLFYHKPTRCGTFFWRHADTHDEPASTAIVSIRSKNMTKAVKKTSIIMQYEKNDGLHVSTLFLRRW